MPGVGALGCVIVMGAGFFRGMGSQVQCVRVLPEGLERLELKIWGDESTFSV